jgi:hypothetical protein
LKDHLKFLLSFNYESKSTEKIEKEEIIQLKSNAVLFSQSISIIAANSYAFSPLPVFFF